MTETIETFVAKLQKEGVQAGQDQAEQIKADAQAEAEKIVSDAKAQAEQIKADAEKQADSTRERARTDMELAARDTVARLRQTLVAGLEEILNQASRQTLADVDFLGKTLHEIVVNYAQSDATKDQTVTINVPAETRDKLKDWALQELGQELVDKHRAHIDLKGKLRQAGFEYQVGDEGTVEITAESVVELLGGLVTPALKDLLEQAKAKSS